MVLVLVFGIVLVAFVRLRLGLCFHLGLSRCCILVSIPGSGPDPGFGIVGMGVIVAVGMLVCVDVIVELNVTVVATAAVAAAAVVVAVAALSDAADCHLHSRLSEVQHVQDP